MASPNFQIVELEIEETHFQIMPNNQLVQIKSVPDGYATIGIGTDAVLLQHPLTPRYVYKVFSTHNVHKMLNEYNAYQKLGVCPFFSRCYHKGTRFLVLNYEEGPTLYECLLKGIPIPEQVIQDVEIACHYARQKGLNPRDIHLKNIILQNDRAKLIDISEYVHPGNDLRWMHLTEGYRRFYHLIKGKKLSERWIEWIKRIYLMQTREQFSVEQFGSKIINLLGSQK